MKKNNNKGISLVELMVALAVLAVLMVAVIGLMSTYVTIYRNRKSAKAVQDSAEAAFDEIEFTLSQAESITISGYTFSGTEKDMNFSDDVASDKFSGKLEYATYKKIVDIKNISNGGEGAGANGSNKILHANVKITLKGKHKVYPDVNKIRYENSYYYGPIPYIGSGYSKTYLYNSYSDYYGGDVYDSALSDPLYYYEYGNYTEIFQVLPEDITESNSTEYRVYIKELNNEYRVYKSNVTFVYGQANVEEDKNDKIRDFSYLKNGSEYSDLYVKTITVVYSVPLDMMYLDKDKQSVSTVDGYHYLSVGGKRVDKDNYDTCTVTYTFEGSKMTLTRKYKYMVKLNETATVENSEFSNYMKHRTDGTNDVAGIVAKVDGENDSISFKLYFGEGKNSYTIDKIVNMKNSYVMHVAN